jgi:hypothetical protein
MEASRVTIANIDRFVIGVPLHNLVSPERPEPERGIEPLAYALRALSDSNPGNAVNRLVRGIAPSEISRNAVK